MSRIDHLLDGGNHFDDTTHTDRRNEQRRLFRYSGFNPREYLFHKIEILGLTNQPKPMGSTTTNNY